MYRGRTLGLRSVVALAVLLLLSGVAVAPAAAGALTSPLAWPMGWCPGFGVGLCPWPFFGACPWPFPGVGVCPGFARYPGIMPPAAPVAPPTPVQRVRLAIGDNYFFPAEISVPVGPQVAWVNNGRNQHTVTAPGIWDSGTINPGGRWAALFAVTGTFDYMCRIHPDEMRGRLIVTAP